MSALRKEEYLGTRKLIRETKGGEPYEYYLLGKEFLVASSGICRGRPTVKYHRLDARHVIGSLEMGDSPESVAETYGIPVEAVREVVEFASILDYQASYA